VFYGIGTYFQAAAEANVTYNAYQASLAATEGLVVASSRQLALLASGLTAGQTAAKVLSHAVAGGVMAEMGGGKFGNGFLSAGVTQALSGNIGAIQGAPARIVAAAVIGGTVSAATGGKFANGALTAAFSRAFNAESHREASRDDPGDVGEGYSEKREHVIAILERPAGDDGVKELSIGEFALVLDVSKVEIDARSRARGGYENISGVEFSRVLYHQGDSIFFGDETHGGFGGTSFRIVGAPWSDNTVFYGGDLNYLYQGLLHAARGNSQMQLATTVTWWNSAFGTGSPTRMFHRLLVSDYSYNYYMQGNQ